MRDDSSIEVGPFAGCADLTATEFEKAVADLFSAQRPSLQVLEVKHSVVVTGVDSQYQIDVLVNFCWAGIDFKILVECKRHKNPVKREVVQILNDKLRATGIQKGMIFTTSTFQKGALDYAKVHGIALVRVVRGRAIYETRSLSGDSLYVPDEFPEFAGQLMTSKGPASFSMKLIKPGDRWFESFIGETD